jgi:hypothetical protein
MEILQVQLIKSKNLIIAFLAFICVISLAGCSDNPQNKAAKEVRQKTKEALDIVDSISSLQMLSIDQRREESIKMYAEAREKIQSALSQAQRAGVSMDAALLVSGNLAFEQASQMFSSLTDSAKPMIQLVEGISDRVHEITGLLIEQEKFEALIDALDVEVEQIEANISGGGNTVALKDQLADKVAEFKQLQRQLDDLSSQLQQTKAAENEIQRQAEEKLRQSESATGSEKLMLEREAYEILRGRKDTVLRNMSVVDQIESIEDRIMAVEPLVAKIESNLNAALERLDDIENSARRSELQQQLKDITDAIPQSREQIDSLRATLQQARQAYAESFDEIMELLQMACKDYKKVKAKSASMAAKVRLAVCYSQAANMSLGSMRLHDNIGLRLGSMAAFAEGMNVLNETAAAFAQAGADYGGRAAENYDQAITIYESLSKAGRSVGEDFACDVTKNYLLTLHGRISLAENLGDSQTADSLLTKVDELMKDAEKFGAAFAKSPTARILTGTTNYIPVLAVDNTAYYEEIRKQFLNWPRLTAVEREVEVNRLLALANEKKAEIADEEFDKIIDPEIQKLQEAIAKGFEDEKPVAVVVTDPNYI